MKRTLLVTLDFPPMNGGVANYWSNLCRELPADEIVVLAPEGAGTIDFDIKQEYLIYRKNLLSKKTWIWPKWLPLLVETWRLITLEKIDFLIVTHVLPTGIIAYLLKKFLNLPYGLSIHGLDIAWTQNSKRKKWVTQKVLSEASWIISNSNYTKKLLHKYYPDLNTKEEIVYPCPNINNVEIPAVVKANLIKNNNLIDKKILLTVGRLIERKGQDMVIKSLPQVLKTVPETRYIIVGRGGDKARLEHLIKANHLEGKVIIYEKVANYELPAFYDLADVFIMPCRELKDGDVEGFGIVFLEAGNYKKPVIAGQSGGAIEAVEQNVTGLIVDPQNENEIAQAIIFLLQKPEKRKTLGLAGFNRAQTKFNWEEQAKKIINLL